MKQQLNFKQWLKTYPIITELFGDLPESYLRLMHYQDLTGGLIEAIKEKDKRIEDLELQIETISTPLSK